MSTGAITRRLMVEEEKEARRSGGEVKKKRTTKIIGPEKLARRPVSEKFVCFRAMSFYDGRMEWFMIDVSNKSIIGAKTSTKIRPRIVGDFDESNLCACLGSTLYCLGGFVYCSDGDGIEGFSRNIYMLDSTGDFKLGPQMNTARGFHGTALAFAGKLYVFGGTSLVPFAECLDPTKNEWEPLPQPPAPERPYGFSFAFPLGEDTIFVRVLGVDLTYNVKLNSWALCSSDPISLNYCNAIPHKVDNTLYWIRRLMVYAYDLDSHKLYSGPVKGSSVLKEWGEEFYGAEIPFFSLGGNEFYFFWPDGLSPGPSGTGREPTTLHCTRIKVIKRRGTGHLDVTTVSRHSYVINHPIGFLHALPLNETFVRSFVSERKDNLVGSSSGGKTKRTSASSLLAGTRRLSIRYNSGQTGAKPC